MYAKDFDDEISMCQMAGRIASDFRFDERCRKNLENEKKKNQDK